MRLFTPASLFCLTLPVYAEGFISRLLNKPVPGGVAVSRSGQEKRRPMCATRTNRYW